MIESQRGIDRDLDEARDLPIPVCAADHHQVA